MHVQVGIPEWNATMDKWMQEQEGMSHECAITEYSQHSTESAGNDSRMVVTMSSANALGTT